MSATLPHAIKNDLIHLGSHLNIKYERLVLIPKLRCRLVRHIIVEVILRMDNVELKVETRLDYPKYCPQQFETFKQKIIRSVYILNKTAIQFRRKLNAEHS